jgi:hypothetical protein
MSAQKRFQATSRVIVVDRVPKTKKANRNATWVFSTVVLRLNIAQ